MPVYIFEITLYISVEDDARDMYLPIILVIHFILDSLTFDAPHMPEIFDCTPLTTATSHPSTCVAPD